MRLNGLAGLVCREEEPGFEAEARSSAIGPGALLQARRAVPPFVFVPPSPLLRTGDRAFWRCRAPSEPFRDWVAPEREYQRLSREAENTTSAQELACIRGG